MKTVTLFRMERAGISKSLFVILLVLLSKVPVWAQPANDCILNATDITSLINNVSGTTAFSCSTFVYASASSVPTRDNVNGNSVVCSNTNQNFRDIWFKFTVTSTTPSVWLDAFDVNVTAGTPDYVTALYSGTPTGTCGASGNITGLTLIDCSNGISNGGTRDKAVCTTPTHPRLDVSGLAPGTYYFRLWDWYTNNVTPPYASIGLCAERSSPVGLTSDQCTSGPTVALTNCPNVNVTETHTDFSNAGTMGNACNTNLNEPQLAVGASGQLRNGCTGGWATTLAYANNVMNNSAVYAFNLNASGSCTPNVHLKFDNITYGGRPGNVAQIQVMNTPCTGTSAVMTATTAATCVELQPAGPLPNGTYYIVVDGQDGQLIQFDLIITITYSGLNCTPTVPPSAPVAVNGSRCGPGTVALSASGCSSGTINWYAAPTGGTSLATGTTYTTPSLSADTVFYASCTVNGCEGPVSPVYAFVNPNPAPTITTTGPTTFCQGDSVQLTSNFSYGNQWSNGDTTQSIYAVTTGNYTVTVTDSSGCSATSSPVSVTVHPAPTPQITPAGPHNICSGDSILLSSNLATGNTWSNGAVTQQVYISASGNYSVTVTDTNGCTATSTPVNVTVTPAVNAAITASGPTTICQGDTLILTSNYLSGNTWSTGSTGDTIQVLNSGMYVLNVNDNGCTGADSVQVTVTPSVTPVISASGPQAFCQGGSVVLTSDVPNVTWSTGSFAQSITVTTGGIYTATENSSCGQTSAPVTITVNPNPVPVITAGGSTAICQGDSVSLTSSENTGNSWSTGSGNQTIYASSAGMYTLIVTDVNGCTGSDSIPVTTNPVITPVVTLSGPSTFCQGDSVVLTSDVSNVTWNTGQTTQSITVQSSGSYFAWENSTCGDTSAPVNIVVNNNPVPSITASGPTTFCQGDSVTLTSSNANSYVWNGPVSSGASSITTGQSGNYSVTVTDANGCEGTSAPVTVTVNPNPNAVATPQSATTFCQGGSVTIISNYPTGNVWSDGTTGNSITVSSTGNYYFVVTDANGCTDTSNVVNVTVNPNPTPVITASGPTTFCQGGSVTLTSSPAGSYQWIPGGAITQSITTSTSGNYVVTVTDSNGCQGADSIQVNANPTSNPVITAGGPTTFCQGDSVMLSSNIAAPITWSNGDTTQSIYVSTSGNYTVTDNSGCGGTSSAIQVTVNPNPSPVITAGGPTTFCQGGSVTLSSGSSTGNVWSPGSSTANSITVSNSGSYTVTVTDTNGCSGTSAPVTVNVNSNPVPVVTASGPTTFCQGDSVGLVSSPAAIYNWAGPVSSTASSITATQSGSYSVTVTDTNGCQGTSATVSVTVNPSPNAVATASSATTFCQGDSVTIISNYPSGNVWSDGSTGNSITVNSSGNYYFVVTDNNGCQDSSNIVAVTVNPNPVPVITANGPTTFCQGDSVILTSSNASTYQWTPGNSTSQSLTAFTSGNYSVLVTDTNGCQGSDSIQVTVSPGTAPVVTANGPTTFCQGDSVMLTSNIPAPVVWSNGDTTQSIYVHTSGSYTVTDNSGCGGTSAPMQVTVNPNPSPTITPAGPLSFCQGDSALLTSSASSGNVWSTGNQFNQSMSVNTSGTYFVTVTDTNGCSGISNSVSVTVDPVPVPVITASGSTTFCQGDSVVLSSNYPSGNTWSGGSGSAGNTMVAYSSGWYYLTNTSGSCSGTDSIEVTVNPVPNPNILPSGPLTFCEGDSVILLSTSSNGNNWNPGNETTQDLVVYNSGTYSVTVTDSMGCEGSSAPVTVTVHPKPIINITTPTDVCLTDNPFSLTYANPSGGVYSGSGVSFNTFNPSSAGAGTHVISYSYTNSNGCTDTTSFSLTVTPSATVSIAGSGPYCENGGVAGLSATGGTGTWSGTGITDAVNGIFDPSLAGAGIHSVTYTVSGGCGDADTVDIEVYPAPQIVAGTTDTIEYGETAPLMVIGSGNYMWSPASGLSCVSCEDPVASPTSTTVYYVTSIDTNGCSVTDSVTIFVELPDGEVFVPNFFSPNGDGKNDELKVFGLNLKQVQFEVYNRWGQRVYFSEDPDGGWDGRFEGKELDPGVFVYVVQATVNSGKRVIQHGNVTLVR